MPTTPQSDTFNVTGGTPILPVCDGDVRGYLEDLYAWIVRNFAQLYAAAAVKETQAHDLCRELGLLAPPDCLIGAGEIDQTSWRYASSESETLTPGSGVLPYLPPMPLQDYAAGSIILAPEETTQVMIRPPISDSFGINFGIWCTTNSPYVVPSVGGRNNAGDDDRFNIVLSLIPNGSVGSAWAHYAVFPLI